MTLRFEKVHGQTMTLEPPGVVTKYRFTRNWSDPLPTGHAGGIFDWVADNAMFVIPRYVDDNPMGRVVLKDIRITEIVYGRHYEIEAPYGRTDVTFPGLVIAGAYSLTVDLIGATTHIIAGDHISSWPDGSPNNGGVIGKDGNDVHGADVVTPEMKLTVMYRHPQGFMNKAYVDSLFPLIGHFNEDTFLGYAPGQVQYLGGPHTVTESEATAQYVFNMVPNEVDLVVGGITIGLKYGSDILSPAVKDDTYTPGGGDTFPVKAVEYIECIRPPSHKWKQFKSVFGWG